MGEALIKSQTWTFLNSNSKIWFEGIFILQLISLYLNFQCGIWHIQQSMLCSFIYITKKFILPHDAQFILIKCNRNFNSLSLVFGEYCPVRN